MLKLKTIIKRRIILVLLLNANCFIFSQNLIQNADFEIYNQCPTTDSELAKAQSWFSTILSPDYFNCAYQSVWWLPSPDSAYSGTGFVAFLSYGDGNGSGEAIAQKFSKPLLPYHSYSLTFFAKRPTRYAYANDCGGVEIFGFKDSIPTDTSFIHASQLLNPIHIALTPTIQDTNWKMHSFNFNISDTINYIVFTISQAPSCTEYIYLDSLSLIETGNFVGLSEFESKAPSIYPNPSTGEVMVRLPLDFCVIEITDPFGKFIVSERSEQGFVHFNISEGGVYFMAIKTKTSSSIHKLIINR